MFLATASLTCPAPPRLPENQLAPLNRDLMTYRNTEDRV